MAAKIRVTMAWEIEVEDGTLPEIRALNDEMKWISHPMTDDLSSALLEVMPCDDDGYGYPDFAVHDPEVTVRVTIDTTS